MVSDGISISPIYYRHYFLSNITIYCGYYYSISSCWMVFAIVCYWDNCYMTYTVERVSTLPL